MKTFSEEELEEFNELVKPVMKYLDNGSRFHPHMRINIDSGRAELVEGVCGYTNPEYIKAREKLKSDLIISKIKKIVGQHSQTLLQTIEENLSPGGQ